ncbi:MAG: MBL fold metallo-hydrolase RNA specificity domain-containing protein [Candidatus Methanomethyliaceae archaeon]
MNGLRGVREVPLTDPTGKLNVVEVKMNVVSMDGFSGHSDRKQLLRFVNNLSPRPKQVLVVHGEESKCVSLSESVRRFFRVDAAAPSVGERIRVK